MRETKLRDVLADPIKIDCPYAPFMLDERTGHVLPGPRGAYAHIGTLIIGWYPTGTHSSQEWEAVVEYQHTGDLGNAVPRLWYTREAHAREAYAALRDLAITRLWVSEVERRLCPVVLPPEFGPSVRTGDPSVLLIAADWQADRGELYKELLLRSAYHQYGERKQNRRLDGPDGTFYVLNPSPVSRKPANGIPATHAPRAMIVDVPKQELTVVDCPGGSVVCARTYRPGTSTPFPRRGRAPRVGAIHPDGVALSPSWDDYRRGRKKKVRFSTFAARYDW